jgi:hypothetical protein
MRSKPTARDLGVVPGLQPRVPVLQDEIPTEARRVPMASARSSWSWFEIGNDSGVRLVAPENP